MKVNSSLSGYASLWVCNHRMTVGAAAIFVAIFFAPTDLSFAADTNAPASSTPIKMVQATGTNTVTNSDQEVPAKPATKPDPKKVKRQLSGAELYAVNCNRCHPERDPSEFTAAQWKTMMLYMRVRANLPASHARAITKYLEDQAGQ